MRGINYNFPSHFSIVVHLSHSQLLAIIYKSVINLGVLDVFFFFSVLALCLCTWILIFGITGRKDLNTLKTSDEAWQIAFLEVISIQIAASYVRM